MKQEPEEITLAGLAQKYSCERKARALLEKTMWPNGPVCPHCQSTANYRLKASPNSKCGVRAGVLKCSDCRKQFTVTVGTIFEKTKVPIAKWMMAVFILCSSKKGISAHQLHRMIGVTYKTAWFMFHRLRHAVKQGPLAEAMKGTVEVDEVVLGGKAIPGAGKGKEGRGSLRPKVVALVERGGAAKLQVIANVSASNLRTFVGDAIDPKATVNTDQFSSYHNLFYYFRHDVVNHSKREFERHNKDGTVSHVNTCESLFSLIKRGMHGSFHHVSKEHLPKYLDEFAFRWNHRKVSDGERMRAMIEAAPGKRLLYRETKLTSLAT